MATQVKFTSFFPAVGGALWPYPGGEDLERIQDEISKNDSPPIDKRIIKKITPKIICDYHRVLLYVEGGMTIFRTSPTRDENGAVIIPPPGTTENVRITLGDGEYMSKIEFV